MSKEVTLLSLSGQKVKDALLKEENYCSCDLPEYFSFESVISVADKLLTNNIEGFYKQDNNRKLIKPTDYDDVNYKIIENKDGLYAWRPLQLIHPALYVELVKIITASNNWKLICDRFKEFQSNPNIICASIPVVSREAKKTQKSKQILNWWTEVEQASLEKALEFSYLYTTDITDCYGSIYTHSIAWALHGRTFIKQEKNRTDPKHLGNKIDTMLRNMSNGQTNGIPQGSMLMDFIAEIVLGYADLKLSQKLADDKINDYHIIRYRDDYRIFTNNQLDGSKITRYLTEILIDLGLKLNSAKTSSTSNLIIGAIKRDKLNLLSSILGEKYLINEDDDAEKKEESSDDSCVLKETRNKSNNQRLLLQLYDFAEKNQNSGQLRRVLTKFFKKLNIDCKKDNLSVLISIVADLAYNNPTIYPLSAAILSKIIDCFDTNDKKLDFISKINKKFMQLPNTGFMDIWLQRISLKIDPIYSYQEKLCHIANNTESKLWNSDWLVDSFRNRIEGCKLINEDKIEKMPAVITQKEVDAFQDQYDNDFDWEDMGEECE